MNRRAMTVLTVIVSDALTIGQIAKKTGLWVIQVEAALMWLDNNGCLLIEDDLGRIGVYHNE